MIDLSEVSIEDRLVACENELSLGYFFDDPRFAEYSLEVLVGWNIVLLEHCQDLFFCEWFAIHGDAELVDRRNTLFGVESVLFHDR